MATCRRRRRSAVSTCSASRKWSRRARSEKWLSIAAGRGDKESKKLLDLARKAKKEDEEDWKWRTEWRDRYYGYWYSGYPYYGVWQQTYWYY